jgi:integrase
MPSVYQTKKSKFWQTDIWIDGRQFSRSTGKIARGEGKVPKKEAERAANGLESDLRKSLGQATIAEVSLALDAVAGRYMRDVGDHHAGDGAQGTAIKIAFLILHFGPDKQLDTITETDVFGLLNWRRKHHVGEWRRNSEGKWVHRKPGPNAKRISNYTINDTIEQLKKLFTYLKGNGVKLPDTVPKFSNPKFWLVENKPRPRALSDRERKSLNVAIDTRPDAEPLLLFSRMSGKRKAECITLEHDHCKWDRNVIERTGKGGGLVTIAITPAIRAVLWPLRGHHPKYVFTYEAQRTTTVRRADGTKQKLVKGQRYPFTKDGLRRIWTNLRDEANIPTTGPDRFRWHDNRHDFAITFLKNYPGDHGMKALQSALDHADFETTANTYAAVLETDVAAMIEAQGQKLLRERMHHGSRETTGADHGSRVAKSKKPLRRSAK